MTPGGDVGSIGVVTAHTDLSGAAEKAGVEDHARCRPGRVRPRGTRCGPLSEDAARAPAEPCRIPRIRAWCARSSQVARVTESGRAHRGSGRGRRARRRRGARARHGRSHRIRSIRRFARLASRTDPARSERCAPRRLDGRLWQLSRIRPEAGALHGRSAGPTDLSRLQRQRAMRPRRVRSRLRLRAHRVANAGVDVAFARRERSVNRPLSQGSALMNLLAQLEPTSPANRPTRRRCSRAARPSPEAENRETTDAERAECRRCSMTRKS